MALRIQAPEIDVCRLPRDLLAFGGLASQQLAILFDIFHASYMREVRDKRAPNGLGVAVIGTEVDWRDNYTELHGQRNHNARRNDDHHQSIERQRGELWRATLNGRTYFFAAVAPDRGAQFGAGPF